MAGHFLKSGEIDCVVVGADRIAANGDVANKIGTYMVAMSAHENNIPFYVAAPLSTIDLTLNSGDKIPIESRADEGSDSLPRRAGYAGGREGGESGFRCDAASLRLGYHHRRWRRARTL